MKRYFLGILLIILLFPIANAEQNTTVDPGITPDSFLWGLIKRLTN